MRPYRIALIAGLALAVPAGASAAKPTHPTHPTTPDSTNANAQGKPGAAKVQFVLRGSLSAYTPASGMTNGTVSVTVKGSNHDSSTLKGTTLIFVVTSDTKIALHAGKAVANGDKGIVKFSAAKNNSTWTGLTAARVIDQGAPATK